MKKRLILLLMLVCLSIYSQAYEGSDVVEGSRIRVLVDSIIARINGRNILKSDLEQPRIEKGAPYSLDECIDQELLFQKAAQRKILPSNIEVEKYIVSWKEANKLTHLTDEEFEKRLKSDGLTLRKYKEQLSRVLAIRNLRQMEISERIVVTANEVETYNKNNPEYSEDKYLLQTAIVPFSKAENEKKLAKIKEKNLEWIDLDWVEKSEVSDLMSFVHDMSEGEVSKPVKVSEGYQFIKMVKIDRSHLKSLEENWVSIERRLQKEKMQKFEEKYVEELKEKASIVYLN